MTTVTTYITDDGKEFGEMYQAKKHECELTEHKWEYYTVNLVRQREFNEETHQKFCRYCHTQILLD